MGLTTTLSAALDCRSLGDALVGQLQAPAGDLGAIALPIEPAGLQAVTGAAGAVDVSPVAAAAAQLAGRIPQALAALPGVDSVVQPLTAIVALAGQVAANDVPTLFEQVLARLRDELARPAGGGHAALLLRLAELLRAAPEGQALQQLVVALLPALGPALNPGAAGGFPFLDILRGVEGATHVLGGLMCLETVLAEAERLSAAMSQRIDPAAIVHDRTDLVAALGSGPAALAARLGAADATDGAAVAALVDEVVAAARGLAGLRERFAAGLAMDEATLAYLDVARLQVEVDAARSMIRLAEVDPARRATEALAALVQPLLAFDPGPSPSGGVAALLDAAQAQVAGLAASVDALDLAFVTDPLRAGLHALTQPLRELQRLIDGVLMALRSALDKVRAAVAALPLDDLAQTIQTFLAPVAQALDAVRALLAQIQAALRAAADATGAALGQVDAALDAFKGQIDGFFGQAQAAVEQVDLDAAIGAVADNVKAFADALAQAQMKPIFDGAVTAIDAATGVVQAVPFDLLPESMKADVDGLVQPIKAVDVAAAERQIEAALGITEDGRFALRQDLEAAIESVHLKFQALLSAVEERSPRVLLADLDAALADLATQVRALEPELTLQPVRDALDSVKQVVSGLDLDALLQPVRDAFGQITAALDGLSVAQALAPVQQQLDAARQAVIDAIRLDRWDAALTDLRTETLALLERVDPQGLRAPLEGALDEISASLQRFPALRAGAGMGQVIAALLQASGRRIQPASFGVVLGWLDSGAAPASAALAARSQALAQHLGRAADLVAALDPAAAGVALNAPFAALREATLALSLRLPAGDGQRATLVAVAPALDSAALWGELEAQRARYRAALGAAIGTAETFRRSGFSEADVGVAALQRALQPLEPARGKLRALFGALGLADGELSVAAVLRSLLAAAPPARLVGLVIPIFEAVHRRLAHLLDTVIDPLRAASADLRALLAAVDLAPLVDAADAVVAQARSEIEALSPDRLLAAPLASFADLRAALVDADPLDEISAILANLQALIARVLDKLDLEQLLEVPLAIYEHIFGELRRLDPRGLLTPMFDQLDVLAGQVDSGLDATVTSFKRLQDALPAGGGGSSASVSATV